MITTKTLNNGLRLVMEQMPHLNSVSLGIWVAAGSFDEEKKYAGISHFIEHMMFKGTHTRDAFHISYDMDRIGAQANAFTGREATCYYVKSTSENLYKACSILVDMIEDPLFDKTEMDRERKVIEEEIKMGLDDPEDRANDLLTEGLFKGTGLGNSIIGTATSISRVDHSVMDAYYRSQYVRGSIVISAAGNFDPDELADYFESRMAGLGASKPARTYEKHEMTPFARSFVKDINQAHLCLGTRAIEMGSSDVYAFSILNNIVGGSMSSRLFQGVREKKGLAYTVFSSDTEYKGDGYFEIYAGVAQDNVKKAVLGIKDELDRLAGESVPDEELESSREQMKAAYVYSQESTSARMIINGKNYLLIGKAYSPDEVMDGFNSVDGDDIDRIKTMICDLSRYSAVVVSGRRVDLKSIMKGLAE